MKLALSLAKDFGPRLSNGEQATEYRTSCIDPYLGFSEEIVLDFTGVRTANSSFINALLAGIIEQHGESILDKIVFKGCNPLLRVLVEAAVDLGLQKAGGLSIA